jgi:hypothetical protein
MSSNKKRLVSMTHSDSGVSILRFRYASTDHTAIGWMSIPRKYICSIPKFWSQLFRPGMYAAARNTR